MRADSIIYPLLLVLLMLKNSASLSAVKAFNFQIDSNDPPCPCEQAQWCEPIKDMTRKEVFAFSVANDESHWKLFDWSKLTTIVMFGYLNDDLMCLAHSHNVRVVILGDVDQATFTDPTKRQAWVQKQLQTVKTHFLDGINFDYENVIAADDKADREGYSALVRETNNAFKKELPTSQISVDVAWKPNADIRFYDYQGLAENSDLLFVMAYDEQSQISGECLSGPNSALKSAIEGLSQYLKAGGNITPDKLVLGLPWYGYIYLCIHAQGDKCYIQEVPYRGFNCSDAAGKQYDYSFIYTLMQTMPDKYRWNSSSDTPYMTVNVSEGPVYQIQFDDPKSLKLKYDVAFQMGLRGVGMWNIDSLDYSDTYVGRKIRKEMFGALPTRESMASVTSAQTRTKPRVKCPCSKPEWCNPITDTTRKEVYAFSTENNENHWKLFDWSRITTICSYNYVNTDLMCLAHSHNVRVVIVGNVKLITMITPSLRAEWIKEQLQIVQDNFLDGINFDVEMTITPEQKALRDAYTALVTETYQAFKKALPYSQISVDVDNNAFSVGRAYDYPALAAASDFLFIMDYDQSGFSEVGPNSDYTKTIQGLKTFTEARISLNKLILGLPWYGYIYTCAILKGDNCYLNSSLDPRLQAGQYGYTYIYNLLETIPDHYRWNETSQTPYFSYTNSTSGKSYQVQFDDPKSLKLKYNIAASMGLRGVGMWTIDTLDYSNTSQAAAMRYSMFSQLPYHSSSFVKTQTP